MRLGQVSENAHWRLQPTVYLHFQMRPHKTENIRFLRRFIVNDTLNIMSADVFADTEAFFLLLEVIVVRQLIRSSASFRCLLLSTTSWKVHYSYVSDHHNHHMSQTTTTSSEHSLPGNYFFFRFGQVGLIAYMPNVLSYREL